MGHSCQIFICCTAFVAMNLHFQDVSFITSFSLAMACSFRYLSESTKKPWPEHGILHWPLVWHLVQHDIWSAGDISRKAIKRSTLYSIIKACLCKLMTSLKEILPCVKSSLTQNVNPPTFTQRPKGKVFFDGKEWVNPQNWRMQITVVLIILNLWNGGLKIMLCHEHFILSFLHLKWNIGFFLDF